VLDSKKLYIKRCEPGSGKKENSCLADDIKGLLIPKEEELGTYWCYHDLSSVSTHRLECVFTNERIICVSAIDYTVMTEGKDSIDFSKSYKEKVCLPFANLRCFEHKYGSFDNIKGGVCVTLDFTSEKFELIFRKDHEVEKIIKAIEYYRTRGKPMPFSKEKDLNFVSGALKGVVPNDEVK